MSNVARIQHGLGPEQLRMKSKNEQLQTDNLNVGQSVMYQDPVTKPKDGIHLLLQVYVKNPEATK